MSEYRYTCENREAFVCIRRRDWFLWLYEDGEKVDAIAGFTGTWNRFWFGRMLVCQFARDWCAHSVAPCRGRRKSQYGLPQRGIGSYQTHEVWARLHAERKRVRRVR